VHDSFFSSLLDAVADFLKDGADPILLSDRVTPPDYETFTRHREAMRPEDGPVGFAKIRRHDSKFEVAEFLKRVGEMFFAYHAALDNGDLRVVRRFIDEESWAQLSQIAATAGRRADGPRSFRINSIRPMTASHESGLDTVRVLINAAVTNGDDPPVCEYWELVRKEGALTQPGLSLTQCPHCGAPITGDDPSRCAYCGERLADPAFDWVVSKVSPQ
jgi:hypothetical protein